jgi:hypothetical protein
MNSHTHTGKNHQSTFGVPCTVNRACEYCSTRLDPGEIWSGLSVWPDQSSVSQHSHQSEGEKQKLDPPPLMVPPQPGQNSSGRSTGRWWYNLSCAGARSASAVFIARYTTATGWSVTQDCTILLLFQWMRIVVLAWEQQSCVPPSLLEYSLLSHSNSQLSFSGQQSLSKN